jgi:hypothetical protein
MQTVKFLFYINFSILFLFCLSITISASLEALQHSEYPDVESIPYYYYYYYYLFIYLFTAIGFPPGSSSRTLVQTKSIKQHYTVVEHNTIKRKHSTGA